MDAIALQMYYQQLLDGQFLTAGTHAQHQAQHHHPHMALTTAPQPHHPAMLTQATGHLAQHPMLATQHLNPMQLRYLFRRTARPGSRPVKCELCDITLNSQLQAKQHFTGKNHLRRVRHEERKKRGVPERRGEGHSDTELDTGQCSDEDTASQKDDSPPSKRTRLEGLSPGGSTCSTEASLDTSASVCSSGGGHVTTSRDDLDHVKSTAAAAAAKNVSVTQNPTLKCPAAASFPSVEDGLLPAPQNDDVIADAAMIKQEQEQDTTLTKFTKTTTTTSYETLHHPASQHPAGVYAPIPTDMSAIPTDMSAIPTDMSVLADHQMALYRTATSAAAQLPAEMYPIPAALMAAGLTSAGVGMTSAGVAGYYDVGQLTGANLAYLPAAVPEVEPWKHYR